MFSPYQLLSDPTNLPRHPTLCFICLSLDFLKKKEHEREMRNKQQQQKTPRKMKIKTSREETSQTKTAKTKQNGTKSSQKYRVNFVFMSWAWDLPWSVVEIPSETTLEKTGFLSASENQLQIPSG